MALGFWIDMSRQQDRKLGTCVYCGGVGPISRDHIPPRNLFAKPRPGNLITVPSCRTCNEAASKDDEYFRLVTAIRHDTADHPDAAGVWSAAMESLQKPWKGGFRAAFLNDAREVALHTRAGIYLGQAGVYDVDLERLNRVAARVVRGLFYHHSGRRIPNEYRVVAYCTTGIDSSQTEVVTQVQDMVNALLSGKPHIVGKGTFAYWYRFLEEDVHLSAWLLVFYKKISCNRSRGRKIP